MGKINLNLDGKKFHLTNNEDSIALLENILRAQARQEAARDYVTEEMRLPPELQIEYDRYESEKETQIRLED